MSLSQQLRLRSLQPYRPGLRLDDIGLLWEDFGQKDMLDLFIAIHPAIG